MKGLGLMGALCAALIMSASSSAEAKRRGSHWGGGGHHNKKLTQIVNPPGLFDPSDFGFSHVVIGKSKRVAYVSGQSGEDNAGNFDPDFEVQVRRTHEHLKTVLRTIKAKPNQVTKINTYVVDYNPAQLEIITRYLKQTFGKNLPAQTLVPVPRLALDGMLFEIDMVVMLDY